MSRAHNPRVLEDLRENYSPRRIGKPQGRGPSFRCGRDRSALARRWACLTPGLIASHVDSTLEQHFLNFTQTKVEPQIEPDRVRTIRGGKR